MPRRLWARVGLVVAVALGAVWYLYPPGQTINLGLDLQGGIHLVLGVEADKFLQVGTLLILALGLVAIGLDTVMGLLFGKLMCLATAGKVNPLIGAAGISAFPMAARVAQVEGQRYNKQNYLLMHAMGANTGGQIGSVMAAAIMLSALRGLGIG